jgi:DNA polymerase
MLDKMLQHVLGLQRSQTYILNTVMCRPPKSRKPLADELDACRPFLEGQIEAIAPKVMLVLGDVALGALFGADVGGIPLNRGRWRTWRGVPVMPTFHPAHLLRQPQDKRLTFDDLKGVRARYDELGGLR